MSEAIRQGELIGKGLMAYETTEELGNAEYLLVDLKRSRTVGITYRAPGLIVRKQSVGWKNVFKIGGDRILVRTEPANEDTELAAGQKMTNLEVWTDGGDHIGNLIDIRIEKDTGTVQQYLFALHYEPSLSPNEPAEAASEADAAKRHIMVYPIEPQMIISAGRKRLMIAEEDAQRAQAQGESIERTEFPINASANGASTTLPTALPKNLAQDLPKDFGTLFQQGKKLAETATQQAKARAKQFTEERLAEQDFVDAETLPDITEQLQTKTAQAKQQIKQQLSKAAERAEQAKTQIDGQLGKTPLGRSLGTSFNQALDKIRRPTDADSTPIDVDAFEVWEDD
ncbi:MAG: hypothetical protein AAF703_19805 [Cyanobacteria bacterium P01_D01_bin.105]